MTPTAVLVLIKSGVCNHHGVTDPRMSSPADAAGEHSTPGAPGPEHLGIEHPVTEDQVTVALPRPGQDPTASDVQATVVIEDGVIPRRLRRPLDLARFVLALVVIAGVVALAFAKTSHFTKRRVWVTRRRAYIPRSSLMPRPSGPPALLQTAQAPTTIR